DGSSWRELWRARPDSRGPGLRTRYTEPSGQPVVRLLRVTASGGDALFSVSELRAYCQLPQPWPPAIAGPRTARWPSLTNESMLIIKGLLAAAGSALLLWGLVLRLRGRAARHAKLRDGLLALLGTLAFAAWWNFGRFHFDNYLH